MNNNQNCGSRACGICTWCWADNLAFFFFFFLNEERTFDSSLLSSHRTPVQFSSPPYTPPPQMQRSYSSPDNLQKHAVVRFYFYMNVMTVGCTVSNLSKSSNVPPDSVTQIKKRAHCIVEMAKATWFFAPVIILLSVSFFIRRWTTRCGSSTCSSLISWTAASPRLSRGSCPQVEILAEGARGNIITPRIDSSRPRCTAAAEISATRRSQAPAAISNTATAGTAITTRTTGVATATTAAEAEADTTRTGVAAVATKTIGGDGKETLKGFLQRLQLFTNIWTAF